MYFVTVAFKQLDEEFKIEYEENMTLEEFHKALEKVIGPVELNVVGFDKKKNKKMKDLFSNGYQLFTKPSDNIGEQIKSSIINLTNNNNNCPFNSYIQSFVHSVANHFIKNEEQRRIKNGEPPLKNFKQCCDSKDSDFSAILSTLDEILEKKKNNDNTNANFVSSRHPLNQGYEEGGSYASGSLTDASNETPPPPPSGSLIYDFNNCGFCYSTTNHQIYINKTTTFSECIKISVRSFTNCFYCNFSEINVINIGNIVIPMYEFLNSFQEKSFNGLLEYYYKTNNFGKVNIKNNEICKKCKMKNKSYYNMISGLPEVLVFDFNLHDYYKKTSYEESFYWVLEDNISLEKYYEQIYNDSFNKNYCNYELSSIICHSGDSTYGHFINFSKINDNWFKFNCLHDGEAEKIGDFGELIQYIKTEDRNICNCFYERNILKGYETYIEKLKKIINGKENIKQEEIKYNEFPVKIEKNNIKSNLNEMRNPNDNSNLDVINSNSNIKRDINIPNVNIDDGENRAIIGINNINVPGVENKGSEIKGDLNLSTGSKINIANASLNVPGVDLNDLSLCIDNNTSKRDKNIIQQDLNNNNLNGEKMENEFNPNQMNNELNDKTNQTKIKKKEKVYCQTCNLI